MKIFSLVEKSCILLEKKAVILYNGEDGKVSESAQCFVHTI